MKLLSKPGIVSRFSPCSPHRLSQSICRPFSRSKIQSGNTFAASEFALAQSLTREIKNESKNVEREHFIRTFLNEENWQMESNESTTRIVLSKAVENCIIRVYYDARYPPIEQNEEYQEEEEGEANAQTTAEKPETEQEEVSDDYFEFFVLVDKQTEDQVLVNMYIVDGEVLVNGLLLSPDASAIMERKLISPGNNYGGPAFDSLDDDLQEKILDWLASLGVNSRLGTFIEESAYHHEASLYRRFLERFKNFLS